VSGALPLRAPLFPLAGAILFPRAQLPLHIFEPRYREMVRDAVDGDGVIAIVQPQLVEVEDDAKQPLYAVGCVGEIVGLEELGDGRFNIVLNGSNRFRIVNDQKLVTTVPRHAKSGPIVVTSPLKQVRTKGSFHVLR